MCLARLNFRLDGEKKKLSKTFDPVTFKTLQILLQVCFFAELMEGGKNSLS